MKKSSILIVLAAIIVLLLAVYVGMNIGTDRNTSMREDGSQSEDTAVTTNTVPAPVTEGTENRCDNGKTFRAVFSADPYSATVILPNGERATLTQEGSEYSPLKNQDGSIQLQESGKDGSLSLSWHGSLYSNCIASR